MQQENRPKAQKCKREPPKQEKCKREPPKQEKCPRENSVTAYDNISLQDAIKNGQVIVIEPNKQSYQQAPQQEEDEKCYY